MQRISARMAQLQTWIFASAMSQESRGLSCPSYVSITTIIPDKPPYFFPLVSECGKESTHLLGESVSKHMHP